MSPEPGTLAPIQPELVSEGFPRPRPRWVELATSADHKDVARIMIGASLGFLFVALVELLLMRLQLAVPENTLLAPQRFNRVLSAYGATALFCFAIPLALGLFYYVVPLQIGARRAALPRLGQLALWLYIIGSGVLYASFAFSPPEGGVNPLPPLSELAYLPNNGIDAWLTAVGLITLGYVIFSVNMIATLRLARAPGMAWRRLPIFSWAAGVSSWVLLITGPLFLGAIGMLLIDRNGAGLFFAGAAGGAPLLWQHLSWLFYTASFMLVVVFALGAIAEIIPTFAGRSLYSRRAVMASLVGVGLFGSLAWMKNMYSSPIGIAFEYFAMIMALLAAIAIGLCFFNLIATLIGGAISLRPALVFALGAISMLTIGLAGQLMQAMVAVGWQLHNTTDATAATHYALIGAAVFGGFAALHYWFPKLSGRVMGERLAALSFWTMLVGVNVAFVPLFLAGLKGEVVDAYKYYGGTALSGYNLVATIGCFILAAGVIVGLANAARSLRAGRRARPDEWGGSTLEWFALSPPPTHNFDVVPDVRGAEPLKDIRAAIAQRSGPEAAEAERRQPVA